MLVIQVLHLEDSDGLGTAKRRRGKWRNDLGWYLGRFIVKRSINILAPWRKLQVYPARRMNPPKPTAHVVGTSQLEQETCDFPRTCKGHPRPFTNHCKLNYR